MSTTPASTLDTRELEQRVKQMYQEVALEPEREFHFETGRALAERLGYPPANLDRIPAAAIDSFAGVGYFLDLADIVPGDTVLDLGSGAGMDSFLASLAAGPDGRVIGVDMTDEQLAKATRLAAEAGIENAEFRTGYIEEPPVEADSVDCVISNGVINLSPDKAAEMLEIECADLTEGCRYRGVVKGPFGAAAHDLVVDRFEDCREVSIFCDGTGVTTRFVLTEAQGGTFVEGCFRSSRTASA